MEIEFEKGIEDAVEDFEEQANNLQELEAEVLKEDDPIEKEIVPLYVESSEDSGFSEEEDDC